jgi:serine/threonine protein kinase
MLTMIGKTLAHYEITAKLGQGGMGEVWLAEDTRLGRRVAIKVLPAELASDAGRCKRFEQEAKAAAALNHPNIAVVHDVGMTTDEDPPTRYMVQEYLQGETLRELLERGPIPFEKAMGLAVEIGEGLKAAHRAQIVHRDLKPENIFVTPDGHAKILDFGLAKLVEGGMTSNSELAMSPTMTMAGQILGTAGYMSPEQVRGEEVDERSDLFALGCVLYEMITGNQAYKGANVHDTLSRIISSEPERIGEEGSGVQLGWSLDKLLAKDPDQRYQSAADVVVDLRRTLASGPEPSAPRPQESRATGLGCHGGVDPEKDSRRSRVARRSLRYGAIRWRHLLFQLQSCGHHLPRLALHCLHRKQFADPPAERSPQQPGPKFGAGTVSGLLIR